MRNKPSPILIAITRIMLLMVVLGLLSQAAQACALPASHAAMASLSDSEPCQVNSEEPRANLSCAPGDRVYADECSAQTPVAVSSERPTSPEPIATANAKPQPPPVKPFLTRVLAASPPDSSRPSIPLSILHCSFQI
jgi:hypothetical protein